jgi:AcrR family transcriptional regulator
VNTGRRVNIEQEKSDRRVRYTKRILKDTLIELLQTQHIEKISVKELCDRADVSRSTFYTHYTDQLDLLQQLADEVFNNVKQYLENQAYDEKTPITAQILTLILQYAKENRAAVKALLSDNSKNALQKDIMHFALVISFSSDRDVDERTKEYVNLFCVTGCINVLNKWIQDETPDSPEKMTDILLRTLYQGITGFH